MDVTLVTKLLLLCNVFHCISSDCDLCQRCSSMTTNSSAICKCDQLCHMFQDCCCPATGSQEESTTLSLDEGVKFECFSKFVSPDISVVSENEAFLMIASCPRRGSDLASERRCVNSSSSLPPVTDLTTGLVYRNEHCALCNGGTEVIAWGYQLMCTEYLVSLISDKLLQEVLVRDPDILKSECNACSFLPPFLISVPFPRSCVPSIQTCLPQQMISALNKNLSGEYYVKLEERCQTYPLELVIDTKDSNNGKVYYNRACASCNGAESNHLVCFQLYNKTINTSCITVRDISTTTFNHSVDTESISLSFPISLTYLGDGNVSVSSSVNETKLIASAFCSEGEVLIGAECQLTQCPTAYSQSCGKCTSINTDPVLANCSRSLILIDNKTYIDLLNNTIIILETGYLIEILDYDQLSRPVICESGNITHLAFNCSYTFLKLNESDYKNLNNGDILFQTTVITVNLLDRESGRPVICLDPVDFQLNISFPGLLILLYICLCLSSFGCTAIIITYSIFKELRTFPAIVLMNLSAAVLGISIFLLIGYSIASHQPSVNEGLCSTVAMLTYYCNLALIFWTIIYSFEMAKVFYHANKLVYKSKKDKQKLFVAYLIIGWFIPLGIVAVTVVLHFTNTITLYGAVGVTGLAICWINHQIYISVFYLGPVLLCLIVNAIFLIFTTVMLCKAYKTGSKFKNSDQRTSLVRIWIALFTVTSLTSVISFFVTDRTPWLYYIRTILNTSTGFLVFLNFILTKRVWSLYKSFLKDKLKFCKCVCTKLNRRSTVGATDSH